MLGKPAAAEEGKAPYEGLPLPGVEDILGRSGEASPQEEEKEDVRGKAPLGYKMQSLEMTFGLP
ncbi:UNVERIFIED_CONTAM: hypothetical protein Sangu_2963500 [Sesamum angustifolium]|uniref:Uncharacterized protein n=1 Tax=Sesamum angustifolium TaxID=2727405 RepID=A0AAW2IJ42_9LAMI